MDSEAPKRQIMVWYTLAAVLGVLLLQYFIASYPEVETISYSQFEQLLNADKIAEVTVKTDSIEMPPGRFVAKRQEGCCQKDHAMLGSNPSSAASS